MLVVIKRTICDLFRYPVIILIYIVELVALLLILFGLKFGIENGEIVRIYFFNKMITEQVGLFLNLLLSAYINFIMWIILFLLVITFGSVSTEIFKNPLNKMILTKDISRAQLIISQYLGINTYLIINLVVFSLLIISILFFKTQFIVLEPFILSLNIIIILLSLSAIFPLIGVLFENEAVTSIIGLALAFIIGPFISAENSTDNILITIVHYIIPPFISFISYEKAIQLDMYDLRLVLSTIFYIFIYLTITIFIYNKRDII